jgi:cytochrome P450
MHYLHASICESMRLYPPVLLDSKHALHNDVLPDGTFVGKGTRVTYHPYAMGQMNAIWGTDCLQFKSERWVDKVAQISSLEHSNLAPPPLSLTL